MLEERIKYCWAFISFVFKRYGENRCSSIAAELTVTSLLALVPLTTVVFALLAFIPSFQELGQQLQTMLFESFVPGTGDTIQKYINEFVGKARKLSGIGFIMLIVTALMLMRTIDSSFNKIWLTQKRKSFVRTFLVYWAILTLGPILLGSSFLITSYIKSLPLISNVVNEAESSITLWLPYAMSFLVFSVMFYVIPNCKIKFKNALASGVLTASLFEVAKWGFGVFVSGFSTYQLIFGALAAVPLFLLWIFLSWGIILFGAEFCHALEAFKQRQVDQKQHPLIDVVSIILLFGDKQKLGETIHKDALLKEANIKGFSLNQIWLNRLVDNGIVIKGQNNNYCLVSNIESFDYLKLFNLVDRQFPSDEQIASSQLPDSIKQILDSLSCQLKSSFAEKLVNQET